METSQTTTGIGEAAAMLDALRTSIHKAMVGQSAVIEQVLIALVASGHVLIEGVPGLGKTLLDRFLFKVEIGYTSSTEEVDVVIRATDSQAGNELPLAQVTPCLDGDGVMKLQQLAAQQRVDTQVVDYAVRITRATRDYPGLAFGASSRGALALVRGGRAAALIDGRDYVTPDDIKRVALPALRHRVALAPDALLEGRKTNELLADVIETVAAPRV
ncbi:MAG: hypothetical protein DMF87_27170 [Acidobacteria bacterium]|nr:MAG: hypothetical protein DMF87_27170 [Acidobacteriota bacterium]